ncbi:hypothetical protein B0A55_09664 [Friedmanniomyces simplex]|uniref:Uncharacterized protein n=1 Tax=Friedmanniomyces simplex TaxID=329884 RepID=A0A4U0WPB0_9PEZI|nr:hypothetical protein B0A55_09664 [Friedmanniomyces simplex]
MGLMSPQAHGEGEMDLQVIVDQQANALQLLHEAFAAERQVWSLEKERMYQRIASLEQLLKTRDHHSLVSFDGNIMVDEVPISPPTTARTLSPLPPNNRILAGHTPLKAPRPPTPPSNNVALDGFEDTPTRNNTQINLFLTRSQEGDEDVPLKGPLSMPELPNNPEESNFTLEALSKRLEQVAKSPDEARPMVFAQKSPGLASPAEPASDQPSKSESPSTGFVQSAGGVLSPSAIAAPQTEYNGVKLKKKASTNFGAPFGQLGGFGGRKMS